MSDKPLQRIAGPAIAAAESLEVSSEIVRTVQDARALTASIPEGYRFLLDHEVRRSGDFYLAPDGRAWVMWLLEKAAGLCFPIAGVSYIRSAPNPHFQELLDRPTIRLAIDGEPAYCELPEGRVGRLLAIGEEIEGSDLFRAQPLSSPRSTWVEGSSVFIPGKPYSVRPAGFGRWARPLVLGGGQ